MLNGMKKAKDVSMAFRSDLENTFNKFYGSFLQAVDRVIDGFYNILKRNNLDKNGFGIEINTSHDNTVEFILFPILEPDSKWEEILKKNEKSISHSCIIRSRITEYKGGFLALSILVNLAPNQKNSIFTTWFENKSFEVEM